MSVMISVAATFAVVFGGFLMARAYVNRPFSWGTFKILLRKCLVIKLRFPFAWVFELFVPCALTALAVIDSILLKPTAREDIFDSSLVFTAIALCTRLARVVVEERYSGMKELLQFMGMKRWMATGSWGLFYTFPMIFYAILFSIPLCVILGNSWIDMFLYHILCFEALLAFSLFLSSLCSTPRAATVCTIFGIALSRLFFEGVVKLRSSSVGDYFIWLEIILCLNPIGAYKSGFLRYVDNGDPKLTNFLPFSMALVLQLINILLYFTLAWYSERAFSRVAGDNASIFFFLKKSYWFKSSSDQIILDEQMSSDGTVETVTEDHVPAICARNLLKTFKNNKETIFAVDHIGMTVYNNQTTCILGHKGSGKSTLINLLIGKQKATYGEIKIDNNFLGENLEEEQKKMGVCPQENMYYNVLTVYEHLLFVSRFKGITGKKQERYIDDVIDSLGLTNEKDIKAALLSWCSKRKLCVAMALVGNPKMLFFDEPTAGMDMESKQVVWNAIAKEKQRKVIVLATKCSDEAEFLGDRIALLKNGELACIGSLNFVQDKCHAGYFLDVSVNEVNEDTLKKVHKIICSEIPSVECINSTDSKSRTFFIRFSAGSKVQSLLSQLEQLSLHYKFTMRTMEQAYTQLSDESIHKMANDNEAEHNRYALQDLIDNTTHKSSDAIKFCDNIESCSNGILYNVPFLRAQLFTFIKKCFLNMARDYWSLGLTVVIPIMINALAGILYKVTGNLYADIILLALLIMPLMPLRFLVMERMSGLKQLQRQSGTNVVMFYLGNLVVDTLPAVLTLLISMGILFALGVDVCTNSVKSFIAFAVVLFSYWTSEIVPSYMISLIFSSPKEATIMGILPMLILGYLLPALGLLLEKLGSLMWFKMLIDLQVGSLPPVVFKNTINMLVESSKNGTLTFPVKPILTLLQGGLVPVVIVLGIETRFFSFVIKKAKDLLLRKSKQDGKNGTSTHSDKSGQRHTRKNVINEEEAESLLESANEEAVQEPIPKGSCREQADPTTEKETLNVDAIVKDSPERLLDYAFILHHATKIYHGEDREKDHIAIDDLTLSIRHGECFCIYGKRNSGKTTLLSLLQEEEELNSGLLYRNGNITKLLPRIRCNRLGVCMEKDPFVETMTIREHYELIGTLRGIPRDAIKSETESMLNMFGVVDSLDQYPSSLKTDVRKLLSLGLAFLGNPEIVLIDDIFNEVSDDTMTTMRNGIRLLKQNKTVIIASSSLNDVISLCDAVGIMVHGKLFYFGSFYDFFMRIESANILYVKSEPAFKASVKNAIRSLFPNGRLLEESNDTLKFSVAKTDGSLCSIFEKLQTIASNMKGCSIGENSIEATLTDLERAQYDSE